jgi:taurine dioxygenase
MTITDTTTTTTTTRRRRNGFATAGPRVMSRTPAGWVDEPYTRFTLRPYSPTIGAEVEGLSLAEPLDEVSFAELHRALLEWKVLFFRDAGLDQDSHHRLARMWGELESHPFIGFTQNKQDHDVETVVRFEKGANVGGYENVWHSDVSWREQPSLGSLLHAIEVPDVGGDTSWADMGAAYDLLDEATKERIDGLVAVHDWWDTFGRSMSVEQRDALRPHFPPQEHPVVRTHPETGRKTIYVNAAFTQYIVGMDPDESDELLARLYAQAYYPEVQCRFHWTPGALAIWDNRATQHYAVSDYFPQRRVMERVTVIGDKPF